MSNNKNLIEINVKDEGVYLIVNNTHKNDRITIEDAIKYVEDNEVQDIDYSIINNVFNDNPSDINVKISNNTNLSVKHESVMVRISGDKMEGYITFVRPGYKGEIKTFEQVKNIIQEDGIQYGLDEGMLREAIKDKVYGKEYLIAKGSPPVDGTEGYLEFKFDTEKKSFKPKLLEDGRVDFRNIDSFESATVGQELIRVHPAKEGTKGMSVLGQEIPYKMPKPAPKIIAGKNVQVVGDNEKYIAKCSGQILFSGKKIVVSPVMEIAGDVGIGTGNVEFKGSVLIRGSVLTGFSVKADDVIEVLGTVEGAYIKSNTAIKIYGGIHGLGKADVVSGGNLTAKFIENATVTADGDVYAGNILHSNVSCMGSIILEDKKSMIVGGKISAGVSVKAKTIGSTMATATEINIGNSPKLLNKYEELKAEYNNMKVEYDKISNICNSLIKLNEKNQLNNDKKDVLVKAMRSKAVLREKLIDAKSEMNEAVLPYLGANKGSLCASQVVRSGVRLLIGDAVLYVRDDIPACRLTNKDGKIVIGSYTGG